MAGYIGCFGLLTIAILIIGLFLLRRNIDKGVVDFYANNGLVFEPGVPAAIIETLGEGNWSRHKGTLKFADGPQVTFDWIINFTSSTLVSNNVPQTTLSYFLTVLFAPNTIGEDFKTLVKGQMAEPKTAKEFVALNTKRPIRAEELADGSFLVVWPALDRADIYQERLNFLRGNVTPMPHVELPPAPPVAVLRPISDFYAKFEGQAADDARLLTRFAEEYYREYHDYKGQMPHDFEFYFKYLELEPAEIELIKKSIQGTMYSLDELISFGYDTFYDRLDGFDIIISSVKYPYIISANILVELGETVYHYKD